MARGACVTLRRSHRIRLTGRIAAPRRDITHPCRWPPTPAVPAIICFARLICQGAGLYCQEPSPISSFTFVFDDGGNLLGEARIAKKFDKALFELSTDARKYMTRVGLVGA